MNMSDSLRDHIEIFVLKPETLDEVEKRTSYTRAELEKKMNDAFAMDAVAFVALYKLSKLS